MYCILAKKKHQPVFMQKPGARAAFERPKKHVLQGFQETLKTLGKINNSSAALVPEVHGERPGQWKKQQ